jgi:hypothetical protein
MPDYLQQVASPATKAEQVTIQWVVAQYFLHLKQ